MADEATELQETLAQASTITIVVHGVGDHSAVNILQEAVRGFRAMMADSEERFEVTPVDASPMLPERAADLSISGIRIVTDRGVHIVLALIWSGTRQRLGTAMEMGRLRPTLDEAGTTVPYFAAAVFLSVAARWWLIMWEAARILLTRIQLDLLRLPGRARGFWRVGVAAVVLAVFMAGLAWTFTGAAVSIFAIAGFIAAAETGEQLWPLLKRAAGSRVWEAPDAPLKGVADFAPTWLAWWIQDWSHWGLLMLVTLMLAAVALKGARVIDLITDVSSYVANDAHRRRVLAIVEGLVDRVLRVGANPRVLVVGHSLGSVVVSHALVAKRLERAVTLVTLGSPLSLMAKVFSAEIHSPKELLRIYEGSGNVECWFHAFRDADVIGRSLLPGNERRYIECGLGRGPHWNYFSDVRLWRRMAALLQAEAQDDYAAFRMTIAGWELDSGERLELLGWRFLLGLSFLVLPICVATERSLSAFLFAPDARYFLGYRWEVALSLWAASGAALVAGALTLTLATANYTRAKTARERLRAARLWRALVLVFPSLQTLLALTALVLCLSRER